MTEIIQSMFSVYKPITVTLKINKYLGNQKYLDIQCTPKQFTGQRSYKENQKLLQTVIMKDNLSKFVQYRTLGKIYSFKWCLYQKRKKA